MKVLIAAVLIILGILFRTTWKVGDNFEFVTSAALLSGSYLGIVWALIVPIAIMMITDMMIGNTNIFLFTWSAYAMIGAVGYWGLRKTRGTTRIKSTTSTTRRIIRATGFGVVASIWFYIWTNFGVWLLDTWGMYPKTISGLFDAYIMGLPFLKYNLLGNLFFVPLSFSIYELIKSFKVNEIFNFSKT